MMRKDNVIFLDIDTQFDFMHPCGKLSVPRAIEIIPNIKLLIDFASKNSITIISSVDAHKPDDPEFKDFPPHCIKNSAGSAKISGTLAYNNKLLITDDTNISDLHLTSDKTQLIAEKQTIDIFKNENIKRIVDLFRENIFIVFGVTTEYCIKYAVIGLCQRDCTVYLVTDAIKAIIDDDGDSAIYEMKKAGAQTITTKQVIKHLAV